MCVFDSLSASSCNDEVRELPRPVLFTVLAVLLVGRVASAQEGLEPFEIRHGPDELQKGLKTQVEWHDGGLRLATLPLEERSAVPTDGRIFRIGFDDAPLTDGSYPVFEGTDSQLQPLVLGNSPDDIAVSGQVGGAIDLERSASARVQLLKGPTDVLAGASALTFMAWIAPESLPSSSSSPQTLFSLGTSFSSRVSIALESGFRFRVQVDAPWGAATPVLRLEPNAWAHVAVVVELNPVDRISLYVNGVRTETVPVPFSSATFNALQAEQAFVGSGINGSGSFDGRMDEVAFYRRALTATEIREVFQRQRGTTALSGRFASAVIDTFDPMAQWETFGWRTGSPASRPLPSDGGSDVGAYGSGGIDMTDNVLLLRFDAEGPLFDGALVSDHSGRGHHATLSDGDGSAAYVGGRFGQGLDLKGPDHLRIFDAETHPDFDFAHFTWSAWVKLPPCQGTGSNDDNMIVIGGEQLSRGSHLWMGRWCTQVEACSGRPAFVAYDSSNIGTTKMCHHDRMDDGQWHHMVATRDAEGLTLYVDGVPVRVPIQYSSPFNFNRALYIGQWVTLANPTPVTLDELAIWRRALSEAEVLAVYERGAARLRLQARVCAAPDCEGVPFVGPDGGSESHFTDELEVAAARRALPPAVGRYAQYAADFERDPRAPSPVLREVVVGGQRIPPESDGGEPGADGGTENPDGGGLSDGQDGGLSDDDGGIPGGGRRSLHGWSCGAAPGAGIPAPLFLLALGGALGAVIRRRRSAAVMGRVLVVLLSVAGASVAWAAEPAPYAGAVERLFKDFEYEEAIRAAQKALAQPGNPPAVEVRVSLFEGISHAELGQPQQALRAFKRALSLDPAAQLPVAVSPRTEALFEQARADMVVPAPVVPSSQPASPEASEQPDVEDGADGSSGVSFQVSAFGFADALGRSGGPGADLRVVFGGLQTRLLVLGGPSVGLGLEAGYLIGQGAFQPKVGLRGYLGPSTGAAGGGVLLGLQYSPWRPVAFFIDGSAEIYAVDAPWRSTAVLLTSGVSWRFLSL